MDGLDFDGILDVALLAEGVDRNTDGSKEKLDNLIGRPPRGGRG